MSTKKQARKTVKLKGSENAGKAVGSPMPMTQEEVVAMAAGGVGTKAVVKRLRAHSPPQKSAMRKSSKLSPAAIGKAEMATLKKSGALPKALRERIEKTSARDTTSTAKDKARKVEPTKPPPYKTTHTF